MKIGILGIGSLGSLFGGCLNLVKADVSFLFRNQKKLSIYKDKGLKINFEKQKYHIFPKVFLVNDLKTKFDIIIIFTKTVDSFNALNSIQHIIDSNTILMSLQNGLDNDMMLESFVSKKNVIYGTTMAPADLNSENQVTSFGNNLTQFKAKHKFSLMHAEKICQLFNLSGINSMINDKVDKNIWEKVAFNSAMNSICALLNCTPKLFNHNANIKNFAIDVAKESWNIAISNHIQINKEKIIDTIEVSCKEHGDHKPSMLQDILAKKPTEIDSINGALVKYGLCTKVSTRLNFALLKLVKAKESNYYNQ